MLDREAQGEDLMEALQFQAIWYLKVNPSTLNEAPTQTGRWLLWNRCSKWCDGQHSSPGRQPFLRLMMFLKADNAETTVHRSIPELLACHPPSPLPHYSLSRAVGPSGSFFPSCLPGTLLNSATYAQALSQVASLKGKRPRVQRLLRQLPAGTRLSQASLTECHGAGWALLAEPVFLSIMFGLHG